MTDLASRKASLEARALDLRGRLRGIEDALDSPKPQDWEDLATEREADEVLEGMGMAGQTELRRIEAALGRIASGDYGTCAKCGAAIGEARLDALPYTPLCRTCAV